MSTALQLSPNDIFNLGSAYGSFMTGEIDQGVHIVLPATSPLGVEENMIFKPLLDLFAKIDASPPWSEVTNDIDYDRRSELYMGACEVFATSDCDLTIDHVWHDDYIAMYG